MTIRVGLLTAVALAMAVLCGCGGGGEGPGDGNGAINFRIVFPPLPAGEVLPQYITPKLMSVVVHVLDAVTRQPKVPPVLVNRPSVAGGPINVTIPDVHVGLTIIVVQGFAQENGQGPIVSGAIAQVNVQLGQTATVGMTMETTVVRTVIGGPTSVLIGGNAQLSATGYDIDDNIVLDAVFDWQPSNARATVDATGLVVGLTRGQVDITVTEQALQAPPAVWPMEVTPNIDLVLVEPGVQTINAGLNFEIIAKCWSGVNPVTNVPMTFTSDNEAVATVTKLTQNTARVDALSEGTATITASQPYTGVVGTCAVTVTALGRIDLVVD